MEASIPEVIRAPRTDAIYNCHTYLTKVPVAAIRPFIEAFTKPGDVVADFFAGSGMTGIAAVMMGRRAALSDIAVLGRHIGTGYLTPVSPSAMKEAADEVIAKARARFGDLYATARVGDGASVEAVRTIWSFVYLCPRCAQRFVYFECLDRRGRPRETCTRCPEAFVRRKWARAEDVPVRVVVEDRKGKQIEQPISTTDLAAIERAALDQRQGQVPSREIEPGREMFSRSGLGKAGLARTRDFFSPRNSIALLELWRAIQGIAGERVRKKLLFAFTSILGRASRRYQWGPKRPLNAQNQTYYIAPVYFEWNVFDLFARKVEAVRRSDELVFDLELPLSEASRTERDRMFSYQLASADALAHLPDGSVDYVFTDPPFGSNIFYSDMNLFHEAWLGEITDESSEAVMHTTGRRKKEAGQRYQSILEGAFREAFRVLKPGRHLSVVFGNSSGAVWSLVQRALRNAGFTASPSHIAILDKGQRSVKGLSSGSEGVVTLDLILTIQKPGEAAPAARPRPPKTGTPVELLLAAIDSLDAQKARNPSYLYLAAVREAIRRRMSVEGLHYSDVLIALRNAGCSIDSRSGLLSRPVTRELLTRALAA